MCSPDLSSRIEWSTRGPLRARVEHVAEMTARCGGKELQAAWPPLVASLFDDDSWGLRAAAPPVGGDARALFEFLAPDGALLRLCYKLLAADAQLKYALPPRLLPALDGGGRAPPFYADLLCVDAHSRRVVSLSLNPFDYYMFHFAAYLHRASYTAEARDAWNTVYYQLACEYLLHFLPDDINRPITPHIPYFAGKTPSAAPMRNADRRSQFLPLLVSQEAAAPRSPGIQYHPRGEVWRSETVLQVFVDVWLCGGPQSDPSDRSGCTTRSAYPACEHVRIARALIKQCHAFASVGAGDPTSLGELRRAAPAILAPRAHAHIRHLMHTWPLDSSFKLVLELWFSFIQPWRYANREADRQNRNNLFMNASSEVSQRQIRVDESFVPFISENLLTYTEIFQLVVPRFLRLNLTVPKNAVMLFRLTKVFSQPNLVRLLMDVENSVANESEPPTESASNSFLRRSPTNVSQSFMDQSGGGLDTSFHHQTPNRSNSGWETTDGAESAPQNQYRPLLLGGGRNMARDLLVYAMQAHAESLEVLKVRESQASSIGKDFFSSCYHWLFGDSSNYDLSMEDIKKVPIYLTTAIDQLAEIFSLDTNISINYNTGGGMHDSNSTMRQRNGNSFGALLSPKSAKERTMQIKYMGDPDLQPVKTFENAFLVRALQQLSSKINERYGADMKTAWERPDVVGAIARQILSPPCTIRTYVKGGVRDGDLVSRLLPPRLSLRRFASDRFLAWLLVACALSWAFGHGVVPPLMVGALACVGFVVAKGVFEWLFRGGVNGGVEGN